MKFFCSLILGLGVLLGLFSHRACGQVTYLWSGVDGNWRDSSMWDGGFVAEAQFNERGTIDNGVVFFDTTFPTTTLSGDPIAGGPGAILLGNLAGGDATLEIRNGGAMTVEVGTPFNPGDTPWPGEVVVGNAGTGTVDVLGGGSLTTEGRIALGNTGSGVGTLNIATGGTVNVGGQLLVGLSGTGSLNVAGGASLGATGGLLQGSGAADTIVFGGATGGTATVSAGSLVLRGPVHAYPNLNASTTESISLTSSIDYLVEVNATGAPKLNAGTTASVGGSLNVNFTGVTPTIGGTTWDLLEANSISGGFANISSNAVLPLGQLLTTRKVDVGGGREKLQLGVAETLLVTVNRNTGDVSISHPGVGSILLDEYQLHSSEGRLVPGQWSSFDGGNLLGGNWIEAAATANDLAELEPTTSDSFAPESTIQLGKVYNALAGEFGGTAQDVSLTFSNQVDGTVFNAVVQYTGTKVNNLLLQVDPGTGRARLQNPSNTSVSIETYLVKSAQGSLSTAGWDSFADNNGGGGGWFEVLNSDENQLGEFQTTGSLLLEPGDSYLLGDLYDLGDPQDLQFEFLMADGTEPTQGEVIFESFNGDFNGDGTVNGRDYLAWARNFGQAGDLSQGDADGDGAITATDLAAWESSFGTGSASPVSAVPEPATVGLALCLVAITISSRRPSSSAKIS